MASSSSRALFRWRALLWFVFCASGFHVGLWLLYQDLRTTGQAGGGEVLARLSERTEDVQRREAASYLWNYADTGERLFRGDALRVGARGSALLELSGGRTLELGPNSLVVIEQWKDLPLRFLEGSFFLRGANGEKRITLDRRGRVRIEEVTMRLIKPESLATILTNPFEDGLVELEWKGTEKSSVAPVLEISSRRLFHGRTLQRRTVTPDGKLTMRLSPGTYWWRLVDGAKVLSAVRSFQVREKRPLQPTVPVAGRALVGERVGFRWRAPEEAVGEHHLVVSRAPDLSSPVIDRAISAPRESATLTLDPGKYYWALRTRWRGGEWASEIQEFSLSAPRDWKLAADTPIEGDAVVLGKPLTFGWTVEGGDPTRLGYRLEVAPPTGEPIAIRRAGALNAAWTPAVAGAHRWRVKTEGEAPGLAAPLETPWRTLIVYDGQPIALQSPKTGERLERWRPEPIELKWQPAPVKHYRVEIASEPTFAKPLLATTVDGPALRAPALPFATYYWRVTALDEHGAVARKSTTGRFEIAARPTLPPPAAALPVNGTVWNPIELGKTLAFSWSPVEGAIAYQLRIRRGEKTVRQSRHANTAFALGLLAAGEYDWQVAAIDPLGRTGEFSTALRFKVDPGKRLRAPAHRRRKVEVIR